MGLGQPDDVDGLDVSGSQDVRQAAPVVIDAFETGVGGGVLPLLDGGVGDEAVQGGMQPGLVGAGHTVDGPGVDEVGIGREVVTGVDVPVLGGDHQGVVVPVGGRVGGDPLGDGVAAGDRQRAALAEGGLDVDDDKGPAHAVPRTIGLLVAHEPTIAESTRPGASAA